MAVHDQHHNHSHGHAHEHCLKMARREDGTPWWTDFPEPKSVAARVEPEYVLRLLQELEALAGQPRGFLLVDARRSDCTGGTVRAAMNLPAHSFYPTRKILYDLCRQAGIKKVIFYCGESLNTLALSVRP
jgi:arsenical-resistance protein 2